MNFKGYRDEKSDIGPLADIVVMRKVTEYSTGYYSKPISLTKGACKKAGASNKSSLEL